VTLRLLTALLSLGLIAILSPGRASAADAFGTWLVRDLALDIYNCDGKVCGKIAWIGNPAKRAPGKCGKVIVWGLERDSPTSWHNGYIYDTEKDVTYNLNAELDPDGTLRARIYEEFPPFRQNRSSHENCGPFPSRLVLTVGQGPYRSSLDCRVSLIFPAARDRLAACALGWLPWNAAVHNFRLLA
jgi:hypothetical protein